MSLGRRGIWGRLFLRGIARSGKESRAMPRRGVRWWIAAVAAIFAAAAATIVLKQDGGYQHFLYILDWAEIGGTVFLAALGTFLTIWHSSIFFGLLFVIATLLV